MNSPNINEMNKEIKKAVLDLSEPSDELLEWAEENINENRDKKDLLISELKDMIYEKGECTPSRTDDEFLLRFLRARHFILNKAHRLYANYHNFIEDVPEYFTNVNLHTLSKIKKTNIFNCPLNRDQHGRRMLIFKIGEWVPSEFSPEQIMQFVIFIIQIGIMEPQTQIKGVVVIFDLSGLSLDMVWYMTPTLAKHLVNITVTSMPTRIEAAHMLYSSWIFDTAFSMIKVLIPNDVKERIHFHNDLDTLYTHIDQKLLPKSLGGAQKDFSLNMWYDCLMESDDGKIKAELENLGYQVQEFLDSREN
ncbi:alpha-tocopherol transfer protein-like [Diorhabda carinulata]|uniref:alpha-tocopherol transfer protein-like n=1 Tax=Diorhabda carinulata TaxID=1163345 RepID=UPI00259FF1B2|nr:alpha-tocopherol transfer protein-like [Diorhabda carinulata]